MPYYDLAEIKQLLLVGQYRITNSAKVSALSLGFEDEDIIECILNFLDGSHFYKSMPSALVPGLWQDVYRLTYSDHRLYLKLQIGLTNQAVVISFKEDGS